MKLSIIVSVHNQFPLANEAIEAAVQMLDNPKDAELIIIDNASTEAYMLPDHLKDSVGRWVIHRFTDNQGVYPLFWEGLKIATGDVLAFPHSDLLIEEKGWDSRVLACFARKEDLGLVGFIGSNEIDGSGGRGLGTASNFMGAEITQHGVDDPKTWKGSPAEVHGRRMEGFEDAAVVDGCMMIFRRTVLEAIPQRENFPPHHFYDRLLSCEVMERGFKVGLLGIACDHISGQTVNQEEGYKTMAETWARAHGFNDAPHGWDHVIYTEAERQWLSEYRDTKHLVPVIV